MRKVIEGFKTSIKAANEISKEQFNSVKEQTKAMYEQATTPHPGIEEVKNAKGFNAKVKAIVKSMKDDCIYAREQEKMFRDDVINLRPTRDALEVSKMIHQVVTNNIPSYTRRRKDEKEIVEQ